MRRQTITILFLLAVTALPISALSECWEHYKKISLGEHLAKFPLSDYKRWVDFARTTSDGKLQFAVSYLGNTSKGEEASIPLKYSGDIRPATPMALQAIDISGGKEVGKLFSNELHVVEQGFDGWVLVQDVLVPDLREELKKGDQFTGCLVLIGRLSTYHLYIMNEFNQDKGSKSR